MALRPGRVGLASHLVNTDGTLKGSAVTIPDATTTKKGIVKIGTGLSVSSGKVSVADPIPTHAVAEAGKVLKVADDGSLEWSDPPSGGDYIDLRVGGTVLSDFTYDTQYSPVKVKPSSGNDIHYTLLEPGEYIFINSALSGQIQTKVYTTTDEPTDDVVSTLLATISNNSLARQSISTNIYVGISGASNSFSPEYHLYVIKL